MILVNVGQEASKQQKQLKKAKKRQAMDNNQASVQEMIRNSLSDLGFAEMILRSLNEPGLEEGKTFNLTGYEDEDEDEDLSFEEEDDPITNPYSVDFMCSQSDQHGTQALYQTISNYLALN